MANAPDSTVIVTGTKYDLLIHMEALRAKLALQTIKAARDAGYEIIVADAQSTPSFVEEMKKLGARVITGNTKTLGASRREGITQAMKLGKEVIAFMEPEKVSYVKEVQKTALPILEGKADMVIPHRKSLASYPRVQQLAEELANTVCAKLTNTYLDQWFGPRTWSKDCSKYFLDYAGEYGDAWEWQFIPVNEALADGKRVLSIDVDYTHPPEQTAAEEKDFAFFEKRLKQLECLKSIIAHWKARTRP